MEGREIVSTTSATARAPATGGPATDGSQAAVAAGHGLAALRIVIGLTFLHEAAWKIPPDFGQAGQEGLWEWTNFAVTNPVFPPYTFIVQNVVQPLFPLFGWLVFLGEAALGGFLIVGLLTRLVGAIGVLQALAITFSVLNLPNEWEYGYYILVAGLLAVTLGGGGRQLGLDQVLRPRWAASDSRVARLGLWLS